MNSYSNSERSSSPLDITIVLNIWRRDHLQEQLDSILNQTIQPAEIWVVHYEKFIGIDNIIAKAKDLFPNIHVIHSDKNLKYFGRFSLGVNVTTTYIWFIDDDVIPGKYWLNNCYLKCEEQNAIISCSGRIIPNNCFAPESLENLNPNVFIGDVGFTHLQNICLSDTFVDYACNSYFLKSEWLRAFWSIWPVTFLSGEDIHLSATCNIQLGVSTMVLRQIDASTTGNLKKEYGDDTFSSYKDSKFIGLREKVLRYHILKNGWQPLNWKKPKQPNI